MEKAVRPPLRIFGVPLIWPPGWLALPLTEVVVWLVMAWLAGRRQPDRTLRQRLVAGLVRMPALLGWEWLHNIAHAWAARRAGRPMDGLEIRLGMPICIYSLENHRGASPRQHMLRALGGPLFNLAALLVVRALRPFSRPGSLAREALDVSVGMNTFLGTAAFLPIPGIDGGPLLKWGLVTGGRTPEQADQVVRRVDLALSPALFGLAGFYFKRRGWLSGGFAAFFGVLALAVGLGWFRGETRDT